MHLRPSNPRFRVFVFCLTAVSLALPPRMLAADKTSQPVAATASGAIRGRVQNVTSGAFLLNARVTVKDTDVTVFTDESGVFRLNDLPAGRVVLQVFYSGLDPQEIPVDVAPGATVTRDVGLSNRSRYGAEMDTLKLDPFTVSSSRLLEGEALATNEQRFAPNLKNVLAADAFGDITGGNPAEFLQFMPGIMIEDEGPQANRVGVRGMPNRLTSVSMDGSEIANMPTQAAIASRAIEFKTFSINNASRMEVTKVPTPAMPADSLGGSVNMVSKTAFERSGAQLNYRLYASYNTEMNLASHATPTSFYDRDYKVKPAAEFDYTLPINKRFGLVLTGISTSTTSEHNISNKNYNTAAAGATPEKPFVNSFQKTEGSKYLYRKSTSLRADWQVTPQSVLSFTSQASDYLDQNGNLNVTFNAGTNATPTVAGGAPLTFGPDFTHGATGRGAITQGGIMHHVYGSIIAAGTRYRFDNGRWHAEASVNASRSRAWRRYLEAGHFRSMTMALKDPIRIDLDAINQSRPGALHGFDNSNQPVDIFDLHNYRLTGADAQPRMDARTDLLVNDASVRRAITALPVPFSVQVGGRQRHRTIDSRRENYAYTYRAPDADVSPARYAAVGFTNHDNGYGQLPFTSPVLAYRAWQQNPDLFFQTPAQVVASEQYRLINSEFIRENVDALYAQVEGRFFHQRLRILAGVRREWTDHSGIGPLFDRNAVWVRTASGDFAHDARGQRIRKPEAGTVGSLQELYLTRQERGFRNERSYAGNYPSVHLTYNLLENLQLRAAYARTYGRPDFNSIVPNTDIREADGVTETRNVIVVRNPALRPWTADNYDLSAEYYTSQGGMLSAAVFRKDIRDFFGTSVAVATPELLQQFGLDEQYLGWDVNSTFNSGSARVTGIEVGLSNSLRPLGEWARWFVVFANATKLHLDGGPDADFQEFIPETANWGVTFNRKPFTILARWNYRGKQRLAAAPGMGPGGYNYNDYRVGLDMNVVYQSGRRLAYFINARNVLNQNRVQLGYAPMTPAYAKRSLVTVFGTQIEFGIKGTF